MAVGGGAAHARPGIERVERRRKLRGDTDEGCAVAMRRAAGVLLGVVADGARAGGGSGRLKRVSLAPIARAAPMARLR